MLYSKQNIKARLIGAGLIVATLVLSVSAQARRRDNKQAKPAEEKSTSSVSLVERAPADYLSGEASVAVTGNQNPLVRLGLSPNGATIVEFPASDRLFNIIPGNSNLVTVEESPTKETDRFVIMRPGDGFTSPTIMAQMRRAPATSVIVQMTSGLVITFLFYPVPQLAEQAHRVVVTYDRNEVVASRRAAGLAVNLDSGGEDKRRSTSSLRIADPSNSPSPGEPETQSRSEVSQGQTQPKLLAGVTYVDTSQPPEKSELKKVDPDRAVGMALIEAIKSPDSFKKWSDTAHGLSLSALPVTELGKQLQMVVLAVRNTKRSDARILSGQPEIFVETVNDKGKPLAVDPVRKVAVRTTATSELIPSGGTAYYAMAYEAPILGARQRLRVAVGRTTAADEPSTTVLNR